MSPLVPDFGENLLPNYRQVLFESSTEKRLYCVLLRTYASKRDLSNKSQKKPDSYLGLFQGVLARCIRTGYCDFEPEVLRTALVKTSEWVEEVCDENIGEERDSGYRTFFFVS